MPALAAGGGRRRQLAAAACRWGRVSGVRTCGLKGILKHSQHQQVALEGGSSARSSRDRHFLGRVQ